MNSPRVFCGTNFSRYLLPAATKLGQGNVFTGVCDSVHSGGGGGVCLSAWWDTTPPRSRHPLGADPPPRPDTPPRAAIPPGLSTPPRLSFLKFKKKIFFDFFFLILIFYFFGGSLPSTPPPRKQTQAYGQWAAGTHPTGMHSCFN